MSASADHDATPDGPMMTPVLLADGRPAVHFYKGDRHSFVVAIADWMAESDVLPDDVMDIAALAMCDATSSAWTAAAMPDLLANDALDAMTKFRLAAHLAETRKWELL